MNAALGPRLLLLALCLVIAGGIGLISVRKVKNQLAVMDACESAAAADWGAVLAGTEDRLGAGETGRAAAECRCLALLAIGRGDECVEILEDAVADGASDGWTPRPALAIHLIQTRRDLARSDAAAELAQRAARRYPNDPDLFFLELETRSSIGDADVLRELAARVPERGPDALRMRVSLANHHLFRGDPSSALEVLGNAPPAAAGAATGVWFDTRGMALAAADDVEAVIANAERWQRAGGDPVEVAARYALTLSIAGLADPQHRPAELLRRALANGNSLHDPKLRESLTIRLILTLANEGNTDEALAIYDAARGRFAMSGLSRAELERSAAHRRLAALPREARLGSLRFSVEDPAPGSLLLLSPAPDTPVDSSFDAHPMPAFGRFEITRAVGTAPLRWVYRDAGGHTRASGTVSPVPGGSVHVPIVLREPKATAARSPVPRPGDGRRRVIALLLDCGDWRIVEYLRARRELPMLSTLLRDGHRAVLDSDPPLTAAALEALVWPNRRGAESFVGLVHRFGVELAGLAAVGENPFAALRWLMPEEADLFSVLGAGEHAVANLLLAHGSVRAGRHSEVTGPHGARRRIPLASSARDLLAHERERWPTLAAAAPGRDRLHVRTIAAELDTAAQIVVAGEVDLLLLRIEPLDILTHGHFAETVRDGQDDGDNLLYAVYRYIDARLAEVYAELDADDVFIVMSDHGIRTAMEHSRHGMFVAVGPGHSQRPIAGPAGDSRRGGGARRSARGGHRLDGYRRCAVVADTGRGRRRCCRRRVEVRCSGGARRALTGEIPLTRALLTLLAGTLGISFAAIFLRLAAPAPPVTFAFYRVLFASLLMAAWFGVRRRPIAWNTPGRNLALLAGLCFGTDMALWHVSLVKTSVATSTLLVNTTPIYVGLYALLVLRERLARGFLIGAALSLAGTAILVGVPAGAHETAAGALLALAAAVFYAGYLLLVQAARRSADAISTVFLATASSSSILGVYAALGGDAFSGFPTHSWAIMGAAAIVSQIGGVLGIVWALRFVPATVASVMLLAQPVGTAVLGWMILDEAITASQALGGCAVLAGIVLVSRSATAANAVRGAPDPPAFSR